MQDCSTYCSEEIKFTCAVLSISSISSVTLTYMWSKGVRACSIHVTRVTSFTLVNICKIISIKKINWEKFARISLGTLVFLSCGSRDRPFMLPLTRLFLGSPNFNYVVLSCKPFHQVSFASWDFWMFIEYKCVIITIFFRPTFISFLYKDWLCW